MNLVAVLSAPWFSITCLIVVMVACVLGVVALQFADSLLQRAAMGLACLGGLVKVLQLMDAGTAEPESAFIFAALAAYALATALKYWWRWRSMGRPHHPFRRSTDFGPDTAGQWVEHEKRGRHA